MLQCWGGTAAANSVRLMHCSYAFLVLVIVATYTANLAAFLSTGKSGFVVPNNNAVKSAETICVTEDSHHAVHEFGVHGHRLVQVRSTLLAQCPAEHHTHRLVPTSYCCLAVYSTHICDR